MLQEVEKIRVAVVDDSRSIRAWLRHVLQSDDRLTVVAEAGSGVEARAMLRNQPIDVMTLDVEMPGMSGIEFLERLMVHRPMPVVMVSSHTNEDSEATIKALSLGAVDCIEKPRSALAPGISEEICQRVFEAAHVNVERGGLGMSVPQIRTPRRTSAEWTGDLIVLGASTGGVSALENLLTELEGCPVPVVIVQHMPEMFLKSFAQRLKEQYDRHFSIAREGMTLAPGQGVLALGKDRSTHIERRADGTLACTFHPPSADAIHRPNVNDLFFSVAASGAGGAAALLTGMGRDGAEGLAALRAAGFYTFTQDQRSCVVYGMPRAAQELGAAMDEGDPAQIGRKITALPLKKSIKRRDDME